MSRRDPQEARVLGLWTAGWLFALLLAGLLRFGDLAVQWPVLLVPVLWALVALRPRRGLPRRRSERRADRWGDRRPDRLDDWPPREDVPPQTRDVPPTREMPASWQQPWPPDVPGRGRHG